MKALDGRSFDTLTRVLALQRGAWIAAKGMYLDSE